MKRYYIPAGGHYSLFHGISITTRPETFKFIFKLDKGASYKPTELTDNSVQLLEQVNKIAGITFDIMGKNSIRLGYFYNWITNKYFVGPYLHKGGKIVYDRNTFFEIAPATRYECYIYKEYSEDKSFSWWMLSVNSFIHEKPSAYAGKSWAIWDDFKTPTFAFRNYPYFGGKEPAPHQISINVKF